LSAHVAAVAARPDHAVSKLAQAAITLVAGRGVAGDTHAGVTVQHRSRVRADPTQPNLRQVHLIHAELHDELVARGFAVGPAVMGENVTTRGIDLLGLAAGTRLRLGAAAVVEITGLRNPCAQLDGIQPGLLAATLDRAADGALIRRAGVMGVVVAGGEVPPGDPVDVIGEPARRVPLGVV
jgi:MOSC domain-containing protein YiiM